MIIEITQTKNRKEDNIIISTDKSCDDLLNKVIDNSDKIIKLIKTLCEI